MPSEYGGGTCHADPDHAVRDRRRGRDLLRRGRAARRQARPVRLRHRRATAAPAGGACATRPRRAPTAASACRRSAYEDDLERLRQVCAPFISDPCGAPRREYVVTGAKQTELTFGAMDIPATTFMRRECPLPTGPTTSAIRSGPSPPSRPDACVDRCRSADAACAPSEYPVLCDGFCYPKGSDCSDDRLGLQECEARLTCVTPAGQDAALGRLHRRQRVRATAWAPTARPTCASTTCAARPCQGGSFNCRQALLPGPGCFAEFVRYAVASARELRRSSLDPAQLFITDRVIDRSGDRRVPRGPDRVEPAHQPRAARARTRRRRSRTSPACPNADEASPSDPNPCRIMTLRSEPDGDTTLYHAFSYYDEPVEALRFSNPYGTIVIDLVSLLDLAAPTELARHRGRSRPATPASGARESPVTTARNSPTPSPTGYQAYNDPIIVSNTPLTYPVRIVPAPEPAWPTPWMRGAAAESAVCAARSVRADDLRRCDPRRRPSSRSARPAGRKTRYRRSPARAALPLQDRWQDRTAPRGQARCRPHARVLARPRRRPGLAHARADPRRPGRHRARGSRQPQRHLLERRAHRRGGACSRTATRSASAAI